MNYYYIFLSMFFFSNLSVSIKEPVIVVVGNRVLHIDILYDALVNCNNSRSVRTIDILCTQWHLCFFHRNYILVQFLWFAIFAKLYFAGILLLWKTHSMATLFCPKFEVEYCCSFIYKSNQFKIQTNVRWQNKLCSFLSRIDL